MIQICSDVGSHIILSLKRLHMPEEAPWEDLQEVAVPVLHRALPVLALAELDPADVDRPLHQSCLALQSADTRLG